MASWHNRDNTQGKAAYLNPNCRVLSEHVANIFILHQISLALL